MATLKTGNNIQKKASTQLKRTLSHVISVRAKERMHSVVLCHTRASLQWPPVVFSRIFSQPSHLAAPLSLAAHTHARWRENRRNGGVLRLSRNGRAGGQSIEHGQGRRWRWELRSVHRARLLAGGCAVAVGCERRTIAAQVCSWPASSACPQRRARHSAALPNGPNATTVRGWWHRGGSSPL